MVSITETVLEMHYHKPLMDLVRNALGLGGSGGMNFYKYSPQKECFIGFDQAYARTQLSEEQFFVMLHKAASASDYRLSDRFFGYFLQFKIVKRMKDRNKYTPPSITNKPYYRVELDTTKNVKTGLSQHELLYNLSRNRDAFVYYACPMLFDRSSLYDINVDLDNLRLADLDSCPSRYADNDNHFIYYNDEQATPVWHSEPAEGKAITPAELIRMVIDRANQLKPPQNAVQLLKLLTDVEGAGLSPESEVISRRPTSNILPLVGELLTVIRVHPGTDAKLINQEA